MAYGIQITVRSNSGEDSEYYPQTLEEAHKLTKQNATPNNNMICVSLDCVRTQRWDRDRIEGENHWVETEPDEMETIGPIRTVRRG